MIPMSLTEIADAVQGTVDGDGELLVTGPAFVDSRAPVAGGLYVALVGERVDGHDFAADAVAGGAAAVLGSRPTGAPTVVVDDPVVALGLLAQRVLRSLPQVSVLALTGSQGKTGTKDYLAQVLATAGPTVATHANYNNELGVPLTVLRADEPTRFLVLEMGARGGGQVAYLCRLAPPTVAAVLNVGSAHVGEFGSRAAIAEAKGEIIEALPADGVAVLNADDDLTRGLARRTRARVLTFGQGAEVSWRDLTIGDLGRPSFSLGYAGQWYPVRLAQLGRHQVPNAVAAAAMALAVGLDPAAVAEALTASSASSPWRMELRERDDGLLVVNDAYNANPDSMTAALTTLAEIGARSGRHTVAVLGEMRELGAETHDGHVAVGESVGRLGIDALVTVGDVAAAIAEGAGRVTGWHGSAVVTAGRDEAVVWVRNNVTAGDVVLVKASRGAALEVVVDALLAPGESPADDHTADEGEPRA